MSDSAEARIHALVEALLTVLGGDRSTPLPVSDRQDDIDAVATGINILVEELQLEITEQKRLRREATRAFAALTDAIAVVRPDGFISYCNPALQRLTGHPEAALVDGPLLHLYGDPEQGQRFLASVESFGTLSEAEASLRTADGQTIPVLVSGATLPGESGGYVWVARDLRELRTLLEMAANAEHERTRSDALRRAHERLEATARELRDTQLQLIQAQKMQALGRLAGGIAHDFNNLLLVIMGCTEALRAIGHQDLRAANELAEIQTAADRASRLTRQLLAISSQQPSLPRVVDLNGIVRGADKMLRRLLGEDIEQVTLLASEPWPVCVDPGHIEQVLVNLAVNARDAMPSGGKLTIETGMRTIPSTRGGLEAGDYAVLRIIDTGTGIAPEIRSRVFEPFFTTKPPGQGTGLGLSTCYGIVTQAGGHIELSSGPGGGTCFEILFPRAAGLAPRQESATATVLPDGGHERIFVVEDEPAVRSIIVRTLERLGYRVQSASNGSEALSMVESGAAAPFALLVTDIVMPHLSGTELAHRLRRLDPELRVLYISGYADRYPEELGDPKRAVLLAKPFLPSDLAREVRALIDGPARREQLANRVAQPGGT